MVVPFGSLFVFTQLASLPEEMRNSSANAAPHSVAEPFAGICIVS